MELKSESLLFGEGTNMQAKFYQAAQWIFGLIAAISFFMVLGTIGAVDCGMEFPYWTVVLIFSTALFLLCMLGCDCAIRAYNDLDENAEENERNERNETYVGFES